ncbi:ketoacyl-ACP synthase III [candidate division KSB1 bacterium]|nr:ketoacyl-ACP synthase III [candidate division KSB1 bacterium]
MITGLGFAVPKKVLTNKDFERMVDTSDEWIVERTGMKERHIGEEGVVTSDLCADAAKIAMERANVSAEQIDAIIIGTITGDVGFPATACYVQNKLNAVNAVAFDISAACSGFLYALELADAYIASGKYKTILTIGGEMLSRVTDYQDRRTCVLFGDGAGAAIIQPSDGTRGIISTYIGTDGHLADLLMMPGGGSKYPASIETVKERMHYIQMAGQEVFKAAVKTMGDAAVKILHDSGVPGDKLKLLITHQANTRIINATAKRIKIPMEKVFINIEKYGNTSAASIPIALTEAVEQGVLQKDDLCLLVSFGGGFTFGAVLFKY